MTRMKSLYTGLILTAFMMMTSPLQADAYDPCTETTDFDVLVPRLRAVRVCDMNSPLDSHGHHEAYPEVYRVPQELARPEDALSSRARIYEEQALDVDGDGNQDRVLLVSTYERGHFVTRGDVILIVARRTQGGYALYLFTSEREPALVRAAGRVFIVTEEYFSGELHSHSPCSESQLQLFYRIDPSGQVRSAGFNSSPLAYSCTDTSDTCKAPCEDQRYTSSADGSGIVITSANGYQLVARWDETRNELVPGRWVTISSASRQRQRHR